MEWHSVQFSQFSRSVISDSLRANELQHSRPPCPSPTPGVHSNSCPSSQWCHPAISSSVVPFSCPQSLPASESFPLSQLFACVGQSTGVSALASFLPKNDIDGLQKENDYKPRISVARKLLFASQGERNTFRENQNSEHRIIIPYARPENKL